MSEGGARIRKMLDAWREQNANRLDPLRFQFIEVLARRAAACDGEVRRLLDDRLSTLIAAYAADLRAKVSDAVSAPPSGGLARGALAELIDHIGHQVATRGDDPAVRDETLQPSAFPAMDALNEFRNIWSEVRTASQIRQLLEQVPANAGPLNSGGLVHRSLTLMSELSPGYLQQFLSYIDTLSWMERVTEGGVLSAKEGGRGVGPAKRTRAKAARAP